MKKLSLLLSVLFLAGCAGYTPLYGELGEKVDEIGLKEVKVESAGGSYGQRRIAQLLDQKLSRVFSNNYDNNYELYIVLTPAEESIAKRSDDTDQRKSVNITANVTLKEIATGQDVFNVVLGRSSSYTVQEQPFATEAAKTKALESIISTLSGDIIQRTALWFRGYADDETNN